MMCTNRDGKKIKWIKSIDMRGIPLIASLTNINSNARRYKKYGSRDIVESY